MSNLNLVLSNLKSDKIKERQEGLASIREVFSREKTVANFHIISKDDKKGEIKTDPRIWLRVFQALFQAVFSENQAILKKSASSAAAERRLTDAASVVRWLTEKSVKYINKTVLKPLLDHLMESMSSKVQGKFVMLDYAKAIKCIVSYPPHLEHLEDLRWVRIVEMGFNVILEDPVKMKFAEKDVGEEKEGERRKGSEEMTDWEDDMYVDDQLTAGVDDEMDDDVQTGAGKKRPRKREMSVQPILSPKKNPKAKPRPQKPVLVSVTPEQVEFASLLSILLASPSAPILSEEEFPNLANGILVRLERFLERYPADSSLLQDYLNILSSTLQHLALNRKEDVERFAYATWEGLVGLWDMKEKRIKEDLVAVLRTLFHYMIAPPPTAESPVFDCSEGIIRLWKILNNESEKRWGIDVLSLDVLRLELMNPTDCLAGVEEPFVAKTFRAGLSFDASQALSWAVLELQADCAGKLFQLSESMHSVSTPGTSRNDKKRKTLENPISQLLSSIAIKSSPNVRVYYLQILLFFIERHWKVVHDSLKDRVVKVLSQFVAYDDPLIQSWVFLNLAAIACAEGLLVLEKQVAASTTLNSNTWDSIWTHSIRRANVPGVCRAACHAGHTLLVSLYPHTLSGLPLVTSNRVLLEIETLAKDMDVQGPSHPFDSVCMFLAQCLNIASQDVRLYRMRLEDKVVSWLTDTWKFAGVSKAKVAGQAVKDIMLLLEAICGLTKHISLPTPTLLPESRIVAAVLEESKTKVIRDYLLLATLPPFKRKQEIPSPSSSKSRAALGDSSKPSSLEPSSSYRDSQLASPMGRERRLSAFFSKTLDGLIVEWQMLKDNHPTAEASRVSLDFAIAALVFEFSLVHNGIAPNPQVLQNAAKLIGSVTPLLRGRYWTVSEKALVALALESLIHYNGPVRDADSFRDAFLLPGEFSGIRRQVLHEVLQPEGQSKENIINDRIAFLRPLWQHLHVQASLSSVIVLLRGVLRDVLDAPSGGDDSQPMDIDDPDGFGPIRTAEEQVNSNNPGRREDVRSLRQLFQVCIGFLSCGPYLQSASGEPTRDKELTNLVMTSAQSQPDKFMLVCPAMTQEIRRGTFSMSINYLESFIEVTGELMPTYSLARNETFARSIVDLLDSTIEIWVREDPQAQTLRGLVKQLCSWIAIALYGKKFRTWTLRNALAGFLHHYLEKDPKQEIWPLVKPKDGSNPPTPSSLLNAFAADDDMRVRFRVAVLNARLFAVSSHGSVDPIAMYDEAKNHYTVDLPKPVYFLIFDFSVAHLLSLSYERMLTRLLSLGNIIVVSSAVRKGAYWHLLEVCLYTATYTRQIETVLEGASQRLGMLSLSLLFDCYASQLAYSITKAKKDFLRIPYHLLGYRERRQCTEAVFRAFTPTNILTGDEVVFASHCRILQKSKADGLRHCFSDIVGIYIAVSFSEDDENNKQSEQIFKNIRAIMAEVTDFETTLRNNIADILSVILRTLGEQNHSASGPIMNALQEYEPVIPAALGPGVDYKKSIILTFESLTRYRSEDRFETHSPNFPAFHPNIVLQSINWVFERFPDIAQGEGDNIGSPSPAVGTKSTTYHIMQQFFADLKQTPLVNEQNRLVNGLVLWMAIRYKDFEDPPLLHALLHGASLLFAQPDLARSAQSILDWTLKHYRRGKIRNGRLSNILIRICCTAYDYANRKADPPIAKMGEDLLDWINGVVSTLAKYPEFEKVVSQALSAWPHTPPADLLPFHEAVSSSDLSSTLNDHRMVSNKFRLVRRMCGLASQNFHDEEIYSRSDFWRLKDSIPSLERMQGEDAEAFASLLVLNHGQIATFNIEPGTLLAPRSRHVRTFRKKKEAAEDNGGARETITLTLLLMLDDEDGSIVFNAYNTLRLILSTRTPNIGSSSEYKHELQFVKFIKDYRRTPCVRKPVDIIDLLQTQPFQDSPKDFPKWIKLMTILLSDDLAPTDPAFAQLTSILEFDINFGEQILPILVHTVLQTEMREVNSQCKKRAALSEYFTYILSSKESTVACLQAVIDVALHLRYFAPFNISGESKDVLACNKWLELDFMLLAKSSLTCRAYTTALLFLELAAEGDKEAALANPDREHVLYEIYAHIDEPDGFYGIKTTNLSQFLIKRFHHERQWDKAFRFHGAALEAGNSRGGGGQGLLESFHYFGFNHLAIDTLQNSRTDVAGSPSTTAMSYRLGWRTETWDLPDQSQDATSAPLYNSLRAIYRERDPGVLDNAIRNSLFKEMTRMQGLGTESYAEIRETAQALMCLSQVVKWRQELGERGLESRQTDPSMWSDFIDIGDQFEFFDLESLMATRISLVRSARQREERQQLGDFVTPFVRHLLDVEKKCLLRLSEAARSAQQIQIALNSVVRAQTLDAEPSSEVSEEYANVLWLQKEERLAVQFLQELIEKEDRLGIHVDVARKAVRLVRVGTWTSEACLEKPMGIWDRFFDPAIRLLEQNKENDSSSMPQTRAAVYRGCAMFAERQFNAHIRSPDAIRWKLYVERKTKEIAHRSMEMQSTQSEYARQQLRHDQDRAQKLLNEDSELSRKYKTTREALLNQALEMHSRCLQVADEWDNDAAIRFCSLWFANFDDSAVVDTVEKALERIPSRKMVFLSHQLTARLAFPSGSDSRQKLPKSQDSLQRLVFRMCREHPFHTLYQVFCIKPPDLPPSKDGSSTTSRRSSTRHVSPPETQTETQIERGLAATSIFSRLVADPDIADVVRQLLSVCEACLEWAKFPIKGDQGIKVRKSKLIPSELRIRRLKDTLVPVSTARMAVDPTMQYKDVPRIKSYDPGFKTAGGINLPKISYCIGDDGKRYTQLFKGEGKDDLRQDAVMEQVFDLVNGLLRQDRETKRRELSVRDYKVVPLSAQAGILEFVDDTEPLRNWLDIAHLKYRPQDLKPQDVTTKLGHKDVRVGPNQRLEIFLELKKRFKPVMRHYFTEKHKTPMSWFAMRLKYTRSVATTSIVGHVLGLGDRHGSNILLDRVTGEVVHIDLGIAFDQGKLLNIPERVPFRMTSDMVDGMGTSGTSGVFQRCAEETLRVLRQESEVIMTVLEVFKHDPLYSWTASELKIKKAQEHDNVPVTPTGWMTDRTFNQGIGIDLTSGTADEAADRALSSVARKLDKSLSVESTVNDLIAEATDPMNLATIFNGWGPHL